MVTRPHLPPLPEVLRAAGAELGAESLTMLPVHLTKTEHRVVLHALQGLRGSSRGLGAPDPAVAAALDSLIDSFAENVEGWADLKGLGL